MEGLFSFLGKYGERSVLACEDEKKELENLITLLFPEDREINETITDPDILADKVLDMCRDYLHFIPPYNDKYFPLLKGAEDIWQESIKYFQAQIEKDFRTDLKYLMVASWRYTVSLQNSPDIINGTTMTPSEYIAIFDFAKIKKEGKGRTIIRKLVQNSNEALLEQTSKEKQGESVFPTNMSLTVLPQFIRRYYDMEVEFDDKGNPKPSSDQKKPRIMNSIFDIGPVLGLLSASTPRKNPYIIDPSSREKNQKVLQDQPGYFSYEKDISDKEARQNLNIAAFIRSFISAPVSVYPQKDSSIGLSTVEVLQKVISKAEEKCESPDVLKFLKSISPEELAVFNQFVIERFAHGCYLQALFNTNEKLSVNISAYAEEEVKSILKDIDCSIHGTKNQEAIDSLSRKFLSSFDSTIERVSQESTQYSGQIVNEYIKDKCCFISFLPLPLTRIAIINAMLNLHAFSFLTKKKVKISKIEILLQLFSVYSVVTAKLLEFHTNVTLPILILLFHYYANTCKNKIVFSDDNLKSFFEKYVSYYDFYKYDADTNLCVNDNSNILKKYDFKYVNQTKAIENGFNSEYIRWFYKVFYYYTSFSARGSQNLFMKIVNKVDTAFYTTNKRYCQEMAKGLYETEKEAMNTSVDELRPQIQQLQQLLLEKLKQQHLEKPTESQDKAMKLYKQYAVSLEEGAKIAGMSTGEFCNLLYDNNVAVIQHEMVKKSVK